MATRIVTEMTLRDTVRTRRRVRSKAYLIRYKVLKPDGGRNWRVMGPVKRDC